VVIILLLIALPIYAFYGRRRWRLGAAGDVVSLILLVVLIWLLMQLFEAYLNSLD
jgi:hypothetical protein